MYDSIVITLILAVDALAAWLTWQCLQEKRKTQIRRLVTQFLKRHRIGVSNVNR